jgi:hypothetical protein
MEKLRSYWLERTPGAKIWRLESIWTVWMKNRIPGVPEFNDAGEVNTANSIKILPSVSG